MYSCDNCEKVFTRKYNLTYHVDNKVCQKGSNKECPTCHKVFKNKQICQYHIKTASCSAPIPIENKPKLTLKKKTAYDELSRDELIIKLATVEGKYEALRENPSSINNTSNNIIVFPNAYGNENIQYIQGKLGDIMGPLIRKNPFQSIPNLFSQMHNNEQFPEYHNVFASSERSSYALVSDGKTFKFKSKKNIIDQIIEDKRSLLNAYVDENGEQLGEKVLEKYERYQETLDTDSNFKKELEMEIGGLLLDMKSVIANDEKTRKLLDKVNEGEFN